SRATSRSFSRWACLHWFLPSPYMPSLARSGESGPTARGRVRRAAEQRDRMRAMATATRRKKPIPRACIDLEGRSVKDLPHPPTKGARLANRPISFDPGTAGRTARRLLIGIVILVGLVVLTTETVTRIDAAHVGIRVRLAGSARGVQDIPVVTGWV